MIKEHAQRLYDITKKGEYKDYKSHEEELEQLQNLSNKIYVALADESYKSDIAYELHMELLNDSIESDKILSKALEILPEVEEEIEQEVREHDEQMDFCQHIFNRR